MRLVEDVHEITLEGMGRFVENARRSGAPADTPITMTRHRRGGGVVEIEIQFEPDFGMSASRARLEAGSKAAGLEVRDHTADEEDPDA